MIAGEWQPRKADKRAHKNPKSMRSVLIQKAAPRSLQAMIALLLVMCLVKVLVAQAGSDSPTTGPHARFQALTATEHRPGTVQRTYNLEIAGAHAYSSSTV